MLKHQFYTVTHLEKQGTKASAKIALNPEHIIYEGHFPDNPITPGVCQIQMIKDVLCHLNGKTLFLKSAKNIKFLNVLTPNESPIDLQLESTEATPGVNVSASLFSGDKIFLKFAGYFQYNLDDPS